MPFFRLAHPFVSPAPSSCPLLHVVLPLASPTFSPDLALAATLPEHRLPIWLAWGIEAGLSGALMDEDGAYEGPLLGL
ncbi:hypothetical protein EJ06DRAFT_531703 [Trichodelitschia bisporula]|uniref:Uncharacterized protein n=1 Tax=Trichodelitschia bisporula TaxID=703511 RepID=A0A6G1HRF2_9PEZI|nr:hypothetical protein EJ06DRAFT_531703 [Trichodelitschia bisporula]